VVFVLKMNVTSALLTANEFSSPVSQMSDPLELLLRQRVCASRDKTNNSTLPTTHATTQPRNHATKHPRNHATTQPRNHATNKRRNQRRNDTNKTNKQRNPTPNTQPCNRPTVQSRRRRSLQCIDFTNEARTQTADGWQIPRVDVECGVRLFVALLHCHNTLSVRHNRRSVLLCCSVAVLLLCRACSYCARNAQGLACHAVFVRVLRTAPREGCCRREVRL